MSTTTPPRRGPFSRLAKDEGPRASLRQLLPFVFEQKGVLAWVALLSVVGAALTLAQPLVVGTVISRVQAGDTLGLLVWLLVALVIVSSVISGYQHYLLQRTGTAVVFSSRRRLIARLLHLPIREFDARRTGDLVSRVGTDTTLLYAVLTQGLADSAGNALIFVGAVIAMLVIDPVLLLLILVVIGLSIAAVGGLSVRIRRATRLQQEKVGELASGVERAIGSIRTVRAAGASAREQEAITRTAREAYDVGVRVAKASALVVPVAGIALQLSLLVVLGVGGFRVASGDLTIASLVTFVMFLFFLVQPLGSFFGAITSVNQALGALGRIQEVLDLPTEEQDDAAIAASVATDDPPRSGTPGGRTSPADGTLLAEQRLSIAAEPAAIEFDGRALPLPPHGDPGAAARRVRGARDPRWRPHRHLRDRDRDGAGRRGAAGCVVPRAARFARGIGRPLRRREEHDPRAHRALLRPDRGSDPPRRPRHPHARP
ncbi:ABC-type multidrug transport system fused ATPase/permease subunit [Microbacterium sp. SORGH_AS 888]|nr:ABC-type multidrug transport system fused ATPase/permease subunit [Microbacterium sp. SORGH_AS_0888]